MPTPKIIGLLTFKRDDDKTDGLEKTPEKKQKAYFKGSDIVVGATLTVTGKSDAKWEGKVKENGVDYKCDELMYLGTFTTDEKGVTEIPDDGKRPITPENVSTTVTNPNGGGTSPPVTQPVEIP